MDVHRTRVVVQVNQYLMDVAPASEIPFLEQFSTDIYNIGASLVTSRDLNNYALDIAGKAIVDYENHWYVDPADGGYFPTGAVSSNRCNLTNHGMILRCIMLICNSHLRLAGVNNAMAVKSGVVVYRNQANPNGGLVAPYLVLVPSVRRLL
jgi:hypothetical protein